MMSANSEEAYRRAFNTKRLDTLRWRVYNLIQQKPGLTDMEISERLGVPINSVTGRVGELHKARMIVINDNSTNRNGNAARRSYPRYSNRLNVTP